MQDKTRQKMSRLRHTSRSMLHAALIASSVLIAPGLSAAPVSRAENARINHQLNDLGRCLFFRPELSSSGHLSCASCHSPAYGFSAPDKRSVIPGGSDLKQSGLRTPPSLTYIQDVPDFTEHFFDSDDEGNESIDNGPAGGLTWDGRVSRVSKQAEIPLLSPAEMANHSPDDAVRRAMATRCAPLLEKIDTHDRFRTITEALEAFQQDAEIFYPYSSRYDLWLAGKIQLTPQERRGLALFEDPDRGNCASCHVSRPGRDGTPPQFTDYGMEALGVPRNMNIPENRDPSFFDLGLCGPLRSDLKNHEDYCGRFRTPGLRNISLKKSFFHNGIFHSLRDVIKFYNTRDTNPALWYHRDSKGKPVIYDDVPSRYRENINDDAPFGPDRYKMTERDIDDLIAFLNTLTDSQKTQDARKKLMPTDPLHK